MIKIYPVLLSLSLLFVVSCGPQRPMQERPLPQYPSQEPVERYIPPPQSDRGGMATSYMVAFEGFSSREVELFEDYMVGFSGYRSYRPSEVMARRHVFQYKSTSGSANLLRNLRLMLKDAGKRGRVLFSGNTFTLMKI